MGGVLSSGFVFPPSPTHSVWFHCEEGKRKDLTLQVVAIRLALNGL